MRRRAPVRSLPVRALPVCSRDSFSCHASFLLLRTENARLMSRMNTNSITPVAISRLTVQAGGVAHLKHDVCRRRADALGDILPVSRGWLPATAITAIVSPMARPMPARCQPARRTCSRYHNRNMARSCRARPMATAPPHSNPSGTARSAASDTPAACHWSGPAWNRQQQQPGRQQQRDKRREKMLFAEYALSRVCSMR